MIYFIQGKVTKKIKIGHSKYPEDRMRHLQTGSPDELIFLGVAIGDEGVEKILHRKFSDYKSHGVWFYENEGIYKYIKECGHHDFVELSVYKHEVIAAGYCVPALKPLDKEAIKRMQKVHFKRLDGIQPTL